MASTGEALLAKAAASALAPTYPWAIGSPATVLLLHSAEDSPEDVVLHVPGGEPALPSNQAGAGKWPTVPCPRQPDQSREDSPSPVAWAQQTQQRLQQTPPLPPSMPGLHGSGSPVYSGPQASLQAASTSAHVAEGLWQPQDGTPEPQAQWEYPQWQNAVSQPYTSMPSAQVQAPRPGFAGGTFPGAQPAFGQGRAPAPMASQGGGLFATGPLLSHAAWPGQAPPHAAAKMQAQGQAWVWQGSSAGYAAQTAPGAAPYQAPQLTAGQGMPQPKCVQPGQTLGKAEVARQRRLVPNQFRSDRVVTYQPKLDRWVTTFTSIITGRQVRVYGTSLFSAALKRDFVRLRDGIRPRTGASSLSCSWLVLSVPGLFSSLCRRRGTGVVEGNGTLRFQDFSWLGADPWVLEDAASAAGVALDGDNWQTILQLAARATGCPANAEHAPPLAQDIAEGRLYTQREAASVTYAGVQGGAFPGRPSTVGACGARPLLLPSRADVASITPM